MKSGPNRRRFIETTSWTGAGLSLGLAAVSRLPARAEINQDKPAILGGKPVRTEPLHPWPVTDEREDKAILEVVHSGKWFRGNGKNVAKFEETFAKAAGAKYCVLTNSGTSALFTSLGAVGVSAGDEVLVAPYTFIATVNVILLHHA